MLGIVNDKAFVRGSISSWQSLACRLCIVLQSADGPGTQPRVFCHPTIPTCQHELTLPDAHTPFRQVKVVCRRLGGAFGGKASRCMPPAAAAAVAAAKLHKPVRYVLTREDDMRQNQGDQCRAAATQAWLQRGLRAT